ncbi:DUF1893 domain-containing protein [Chloroflexota bacterium]
MYTHLFDQFLISGDTLRVYEDSKLLFSSEKDGLLPLLEYIDGPDSSHRQVVIFDRIIGNAAALLSVLASCREVFSPLGSQLAVQTLGKHRIDYHITEIVPYIQQANREDMCPMEKLSLDKGPEEFYEALKRVVR